MLRSICHRFSTVRTNRVKERIRVRSLFLHVIILLTTGGGCRMLLARLGVLGHICTTRVHLRMPSIEESVARAAAVAGMMALLQLRLEGGPLRNEAKSVAS